MKGMDKISLKVPLERIGGIFFLSCFLICSLFSGNVSADEVQPEPGELHALSAVLVDGDTGRVLYGKEDDVKRANASTTKIMTCILALENAQLGDIVGVSSYAASMPNVQLGIEKGEYYTMEDLLYSLMLESHNDVAVAVAEHVGGDVENFAKMMNDKAKTLGCSNTHFFTPNGLDYKKDETFHGTTATDLAKIMSYCVWKSPQKKKFLTITQTKEHGFTDYVKQENVGYVPGSRTFICRNHNLYLEQNSECISGKTGFTGDAGYCYVGAVESEGRHFAVALLGSGWPNHKNYKWEDCNRLFGFGTKYYHLRNLPDVSGGLKQVTLLQAANGSYALGNIVKMRPYVKNCKGQVLLADWEKIKITAEYPKQWPASTKGEKTIGNLRVFVGNHMIKNEKIKVRCAVPRRNLTWYFQGILYLWCGYNRGN